MIIVNNYQELHEVVKMFAQGYSSLTIIESKPGYGKSKSVENALENVKHIKFLGHVSPLSMFTEIYRNQDNGVAIIIFDDIDTLLTNRDSVSLIKQYTESSGETKEVAWFTSSNRLKISDAEEIPSRYFIKSRAIILTNNYKKLQEKIPAIIDRAYHVILDFKKEVLLQRTKELIPIYPGIKDTIARQEVFDFLKKWYKFSSNLSLRSYIKGLQFYSFYKGNSGWHYMFLKELMIDKKLIAINYLLQKYDNDKDRIVEWTRKNHGARTLFFEYKRKFVNSVDIERPAAPELLQLM